MHGDCTDADLLNVKWDIFLVLTVNHHTFIIYTFNRVSENIHNHKPT